MIDYNYIRTLGTLDFLAHAKHVEIDFRSSRSSVITQITNTVDLVSKLSEVLKALNNCEGVKYLHIVPVVANTYECRRKDRVIHLFRSIECPGDVTVSNENAGSQRAQLVADVLKEMFE